MKHDTPAAGELVSLSRFRPLRRYAMLIAVLLAMALGFPTRAAGPAFLVKDINTTPDPHPDSSPHNLLAVGNAFYFVADNGNSGAELWKSDGTPGGTTLVKDINPGAGGSDPAFLTDVNGTLFFSASDGGFFDNRELWKSDGTPAGTVRVKDIRPGPFESNPSGLTRVGALLYFAADDGSGGSELWKSDGTPAGTVRVKDIRPGPFGSAPFALLDVGGSLFFIADDGSHGAELWTSDGTPAGTHMVVDMNVGLCSLSARSVYNWNGTLYFSAADGAGCELWKIVGTTPTRVADIFPGATGSYPAELTGVNGTLYFAASGTTTGLELWKSGSGGTALVRKFSDLYGLTEVNGALFFIADDGSSGYELWKSNGTPAGTVLVKDIVPGADSSKPGDQESYLTKVGNTLYFRAFS